MYTKREQSVITNFLAYMFAYTSVAFALLFSLVNSRARVRVYTHTLQQTITFLVFL